MDRRSFLKVTAGIAAVLGLPENASAVVDCSNNTVSIKRQIVLETEPTGLDPKQGHRIAEVACIELIDRKITGRCFHRYINPERKVDTEWEQMTGLTSSFLQNKPAFAEIAPAFLEFINGAELIIHNAMFDVAFLNNELELARLPTLGNYCPNVIDTLKLAKEVHPRKKNSLNALCERYQIDNSRSELHGALPETELLAEIYLTMTKDQVMSGLYPYRLAIETL